MRLDQLIHQGPDFVQAQLGGGVWVEHGGVVYMLALARQGRFHRQRLDVDVGLHQRRQLRGQGADLGGLDAVLVHQAGHLHAAALRQVINQAVVGHVAVNHLRLAGLEGVDDERAILVAALGDDLQLAALERRRGGLPLGNLVFAAQRVFIQRQPVLLHQVGPVALDEPGRVLAEVLARLGDEVAGAAQQVVAHVVGQVAVAGAVGLGRGHLPDERVQVLPVALKAQVEGHVVDAGAQVVDVTDGHADVARQGFGRALHAVAQAHGLDGAGARDGPAVHGHGVHVLEEGHIRADLFHIAAHSQHHRDGAQRAHDAADAEGVGDGLAQPVLLGDFKVDDGARPVAAHLEHADRVVGAVQRGPPVQRGLQGGLDAEVVGDLVRHDLRRAQPHRVDIHQADGGIGERRIAQDVAQQVLGKDRAARAEESNFGHAMLP